MKTLRPGGCKVVEAVRIAEVQKLGEESDGARQTLIDVVRHDIATPLAVARGCIEHLRAPTGTLSGEQQDEIFQALDRSISGLERLSSNLRSDARLENPALYEEFRTIEVGQLLDEVRGDIVDYAELLDIELVIEGDPDLREKFEGSPLLVRQAIQNLLTNAIKHSPKGSQVTLTARVEDASIRFDVTDAGPGIPSKDQGSLFDRFTASRSPLSGPVGLGIGLSIVKRVADSHGGAVGVASRPGHGSTFWITFPLTREV